MSNLNRFEQAQRHLQNGQYDEALKLGQSLARSSGANAEVQNLIGLSAIGAGNVNLAQIALQKATQLAPQSSSLWNNLGKFAAQQKNHPLMLSSFLEAYKLNPDDLDAATQAVTAYLQLGEYEKATALSDEICTRPNASESPRAQAQRISLRTDIIPIEQWHTLWPGMPVHLWPLEYNCQVALFKTIWSWGYAQEDFESYLFQLRHLATKAVASELVENTLVTNAYGYLNMFTELVHHVPVPAANPQLPPLYAIGDSHTLPPMHQTVTWQGRPHQLKPSLMMGCKLWDIAKPGPTIHRAVFARHMASMPAGAPVIISMGEIDARANFGIYRHAQKRGVPWQSVIASTVGPAFNWLVENAQGHPLIISGIPAPLGENKLKQAGEQNRADYIACVTAINEALKAGAAERGLPFIDIFRYTTENPLSFIEAYHLRPGGLPQALAGYLIAA